MAPLVPSWSESVPEVSIIIPLHRDNHRFRKCLEKCLTMASAVQFEVLIVADNLPADLPKEVVGVSTYSQMDTSPAVKRDRALEEARGNILAFLDDDAFPAEGWLEGALEAFADSTVHAVGGPGLTPPDSSWRERLGGAIYESRLGSGTLRYRFLPVGRPRDVNDFPAYNLFIRRQALLAVGGWASNFYGGEDTKLCLELVRAGFRVQYHPDVRVYHHRRPVLFAHLKQVANVGRHRGYFVRRYPQTSRRAVYFGPALIALTLAPSLVAGAKSLVRRRGATVVVIAAVWLGLSATALNRTGPAALLFPPTLVAHHLAYGLSFIRGLLGQRLVV